MNPILPNPAPIFNPSLERSAPSERRPNASPTASSFSSLSPSNNSSNFLSKLFSNFIQFAKSLFSSLFGGTSSSENTHTNYSSLENRRRKAEQMLDALFSKQTIASRMNAEQVVTVMLVKYGSQTRRSIGTYDQTVINPVRKQHCKDSLNFYLSNLTNKNIQEKLEVELKVFAKGTGRSISYGAAHAEFDFRSSRDDSIFYESGGAGDSSNNAISPREIYSLLESSMPDAEERRQVGREIGRLIPA